MDIRGRPERTYGSTVNLLCPPPLVYHSMVPRDGGTQVFILWVSRPVGPFYPTSVLPLRVTNTTVTRNIGLGIPS